MLNVAAAGNTNVALAFPHVSTKSATFPTTDLIGTKLEAIHKHLLLSFLTLRTLENYLW